MARLDAMPGLNTKNPQLYLATLYGRCMADTAYWNRRSGATVTLPTPIVKSTAGHEPAPDMYAAAVEELAADCQ